MIAARVEFLWQQMSLLALKRSTCSEEAWFWSKCVTSRGCYRYRLSTFGRRAFSVADLTVWNSLLDSFHDPVLSKCNINVNVNLYSTLSQKAPLMRSMCRVLIKKTRLQCTTKTVNLHVWLTQIVLQAQQQQLQTIAEDKSISSLPLSTHSAVEIPHNSDSL